MPSSVRAPDGQLTFADLDDGDDYSDRSLFDTTLVVVDLETTGGSPTDDRITEIGAVKIRGGEVIGEFATLVDPGCRIPPQIVTLTGITEAMVTDAPRIGEVLPSFVEFARGAILVAHNARFDMGFLRHNAARLDIDWPFAAGLCTVTMARRILTRDEAPSVRLSALADLFRVSVKPTHRALDDARATVEVFHHLLERVGNQGVGTYRELTAYLPATADPRLRAKRSMAAHLPARPGVYLFRGPSAEVLYVGTAVDLRRRVMSYFTGNDPRRRMAEMVMLATRVEHVECAHALEAGVRELRLLAAHAPAYNRRSTQPHRGWWVTLSAERFGRLKVTRRPGEVSVGPVGNRTTAAAIADLITSAAGLRSCTTRLGKATHHWCRSESVGGPRIGGCQAASDRPLTLSDYLPRIDAAQSLLSGSSDALLDVMTARLTRLAEAQMFESAARQRDRLSATIDTLARCQRLGALCAIAELVVAHPDQRGGWELAVIRHGRLASAGVARRGVAPMPVVDMLVAAGETVVPGSGPLCGAPVEEVGLIYRWIGEPGTRIVSATEGFALPAACAERRLVWSAAAHAAREPRRAG
ncbi:DEDD exonuclease domain-containing protein [Gordonia sp. NPDC003424]